MKRLKMKLLLILLVGTQYSYAQGVVGNGGNGKNFLYYLYQYGMNPQRVPLPDTGPKLTLRLESYPLLTEEEKRMRELRCREFFTTAYLVWAEVDLESFDEGDKFNITNPYKALFKLTGAKKEFFNEFKSLNFDYLCQEPFYHEAYIFDQFGASYLGANFPDKLQIAYNPNRLSTESERACYTFLMSPLIYDECPRLFSTLIPFHEVMSMLLPKYENTGNYSLSYRYFYQFLLELNKREPRN
ncbi:MAG: hypothetical protein R3A80_12280 [Bdellovibrionota bacterium]